MHRLTHRDNAAVFICSKIVNGWVVTVNGYDPLLHPVTERIYCDNIQDVKDTMELFYSLPLLEKD